MTQLIFLHGFTNSSRSWSEIKNNINNPSISFDCPGHGNNLIKDLSKPYTFEKWCEEFKNYLRKNKLNKIHLCGYSMGGRLAISFVSKYPKIIESLILISTTAGIKNKKQRKNKSQNENEISNKIINDYPLFLKEWQNLDFFSKQRLRNPKAYKNQQKIRENQNPHQLAYIMKNLGTGKMPNYWDIIPNFKFPTLIICGNEDKKYCSIGKKMNNNIPNSQLKIIQNSGHTPQIEQPNEVIKIINRFFKSRDFNY